MPRLVDLLRGLPAFEEAVAAATGGSAEVAAPSFVHAYLSAALLERRPWSGSAVLLVAPDQDTAEELEHELTLYCPDRAVVYLPPRGVWHGSEGEVKPRVAGRRARALWELERPDGAGDGTADQAERGGAVVIVEATTLLEGVVEPLGPPLNVSAGARVEFEALVRNLAGLGYTRVDQVEDAGEFSVRGGIIDVFPVTERAPVRMEFWGDDVDSLRSFSVYSQRSLGPVETTHLYAAGERHGARPRAITSLLPEGTRVIRFDPARGRARVEAFEADLADLLGGSAEGGAPRRRGRARRAGRRRHRHPVPRTPRRAGAVVLRGRLRLHGLGHGRRRARLLAHGHLRRTCSCRARHCALARGRR